MAADTGSSSAARAIHDDDGKPLCMVGVVMDVTERKQVEKALEQERNLLRTLIDNLPDHVYVKDARAGWFPRPISP